ncbi:MAG: Tellurite resistance protein TerB [Alphaproteobacteria bacterium BRH_c36]|nr:MAG: Tellurite resistance protein TerB [Alphaproteobacteria bacterium BRH_c36]
MTSQLSPQEALIYAMITMAATDNKMSDAELRRIGTMVKELPAFDGFDETTLVGHAQACGLLMSGQHGLDSVLDAVADSLPGHMRETAYVLCCEVAASDEVVRREEQRFLQLLAQRLGLDQLTCSALARAASARHQRP